MSGCRDGAWLPPVFGRFPAPFLGSACTADSSRLVPCAVLADGASGTESCDAVHGTGSKTPAAVHKHGVVQHRRCANGCLCANGAASDVRPVREWRVPLCLCSIPHHGRPPVCHGAVFPGHKRDTDIRIWCESGMARRRNAHLSRCRRHSASARRSKSARIPICADARRRVPSMCSADDHAAPCVPRPRCEWTHRAGRTAPRRRACRPAWQRSQRRCPAQ